MTSPSLIEADSLTRRFGPVLAVDALSLRVARGEVLGLLGPNGAGKTTTLKMLTGFLTPDDGAARIAGFDVGTDGPAARRRLGYVPEGAPLYEDMTPRGFLAFIARVRGMRGDEAIKTLSRAAKAVHIEPVLDRRIDTLSKGYRRRVALAQAILHDPDVLILDEPTDGLDPNQKHEVRQLIEEMAPRKAIIISTHILEEVEALCTRAVIIDRGHIVADGAPSGLKARSRYNGAVTIGVHERDVARLASMLAGLAETSAVESRRDAAGFSLTVLPKGTGDLMSAVRRKLAELEIVPTQIASESGRLEDVFRNLTHGEAPSAAPDGREALS